MPEPQSNEVLVADLFLSFNPVQRRCLGDRKGYLLQVSIGERIGQLGPTTLMEK
jgi:NADPH-dependent curcumin reductase CurA|tara:strand:+ start:58 stop:219 length:162 start_codon:yes stop_codon:yes gene_type:complete